MRYIKFLKNKDYKEQQQSMIEIFKKFGESLFIIDWLQDDLVTIGTDKEHILNCAVRVILDTTNNLKPFQISSINKNIATKGNIIYNGDMSLIGKHVSQLDVS